LKAPLTDPDPKQLPRPNATIAQLYVGFLLEKLAAAGLICRKAARRRKRTAALVETGPSIDRVRKKPQLESVWSSR
jgi:hypothetical protein